MIGVDTNVLARFITQDDPVQAAAATRLFSRFSVEDPGYVAIIAVVELVWVLKSSYHSERSEIARVLEALLRSRELAVERAELVAQALRGYVAGTADFADYLIERCGHAAECQYTVTFDRDAAGSTGMRLIG
jgi:predicted nucleic-acid-binding protein